MHHAYLLIGDIDTAKKHIPKKDLIAGADVSLLQYDSFGVGEARSLQNLSMQKPVSNEYRVFVVAFNTITTEAQNALLKLLEDPSEAARFYLITVRDDLLIPTLRSRLMNIDILSELHEVSADTEHFLESSYAERLGVVADRMKSKDEPWARRLLDELEVWIHSQHDATLMEEILFLRRYDRTRSASLKMLLEHLALSLPVTRK